MSQLGVILQESLQRDREERTILGLLTEPMESVNRDNHDDREPRRRRSLKERLRFTGMGCCGATWGSRPASVRHDEGEEDEDDERRQLQQRLQETNPGQRSSSSDPDCLSPNPSVAGMNLAAALAAERQFRGTQEPETQRQGTTGNNFRQGGAGEGAAPGTPWRVSLMRLLEEGEGGDAEVTVTVKENGGGGNDTVCCVCMGRKKGAAFIPCGHTFCRVCSRELWLNRGTCPLCNRSILEILDIF